MTSVECVLDCKCLLGEGPAWSASEGALYWTDVPARRLHRLTPGSGEHRTWDMPEMVTAVTLRRSGGLLLASRTGVDLFDPGSGDLRRLAAPEAHMPGNRSNDGGCDRRGRLWYATMQNNLADDGGDLPIEGEKGALYRVDPDGSFRRMDGPFGIGNTLAWSPDDRTMYFADSLAATIYAYDFDLEAGSIADRRVFTRAEAPGVPDGSTVDAEGFLWNARWGGSCLVRFAPDGAIDRAVELPCARVTNGCFGGPDLDTLYVTTARQGLSPEERASQPLAGGIFAIRGGLRGLPDGVFAG